MKPIPFWWRMGARIRRRSTALDFALLAWLIVMVGWKAVNHG